MKNLLLFILFLPVLALGQTKSWLGNTTTIWPSQTTNSLLLSSGDVTAKINNLKTSGSENVKDILTLQRRGTNVFDVDSYGSAYVGYAAKNVYYDTTPKLAVVSSAAHNSGRAWINLGSYDDVNSQTVQNNIDMVTSTDRTELDFKMWGNDGTGVEFAPFSGSLPFLFNAANNSLTGSLLDIQYLGLSVATFNTVGNLALSTVNNVTITSPATNAVLTIDDGKTLHVTGNVTALSGSHTGTSSGTNTGDQTSVTGNAGTATALQTARTINGTSFDGTANITVTAAAGTLTGSTLASGVTASSLTSFGTAPALGDATATTASAGNSSTHVATTAFVANSFPRILDKVRTATTVSNSVVETTFYTYTVTGGLLGSSSGVNLKMRGTCFNNNTAAAWTVKVKFGGTVIYSDTTSSQSTSANTRAWSIDLDLVNYASTSIQHGGMNFQLSNSSAPDSGDAAGVSALSDASLTTPVMFAAGSKDTTSNQDLVVTWTNGATGAISGTVEFATLTLIP